jgi:creatinine amidohydrolase
MVDIVGDMESAIDVSKNSWASKPFQEIKEIGERDGSILVVPIGSIEQHGNHLPVATDTILVEAVAHFGAERVADEVPLLVTPTVWSGFSPHHLPFGGTISLDFDTLREMIEQTVDRALENGFDAVLLLNGHGGNMPLVDGVVNTIGSQHSDTEILGLTYFELATEFIHDIRESDNGGMAHGGEFETSLLLHLRPELVGEERTATYWDEPYDRGSKDLLNGGPLAVYRTFEEYSASGAIGDPELASAEKGEEIFNLLGVELEDLLREIHGQNR